MAEHPDLPGCIAVGDTLADAMAELDQARDLWLAARKEEGLSAPAPQSTVHTGDIHLRMPSALHTDLVRDAQRNCTSLNQMLNVVLAEAVGKMESRSVQVTRVSPRTHSSVAVENQVPKAVLLFQRGDRGRAKQVLEPLSSREREFTLGLMEFAQANFAQALEHFTSSYQQGLEFTEDASAIYHAMPKAPSVNELFKQLLPLLSSARDQPNSDGSRPPCLDRADAWQLRGSGEPPTQGAQDGLNRSLSSLPAGGVILPQKPVTIEL